MLFFHPLPSPAHLSLLRSSSSSSFSSSAEGQKCCAIRCIRITSIVFFTLIPFYPRPASSVHSKIIGFYSRKVLNPAYSLSVRVCVRARQKTDTRMALCTAEVLFCALRANVQKTRMTIYLIKQQLLWAGFIDVPPRPSTSIFYRPFVQDIRRDPRAAA